MGLSALPASSPPLSQVSRVTSPSHVETLQASLLKEAFHDGCYIYGRPVIQSFAGVYQAKWPVFCGWCESRGCHPMLASVMGLADLFLFLWDMKHLSLLCIRGYRSALIPIFWQAGLDVSQDLDMSAPKSALPCSPHIPAWDLSLALRYLMKSRYEPLHLASLRDIALKSLFLLAFASAHQVSKLHGLSAEVSHSKGWSSMTFSLTPDFVAKTQLPGDESKFNFTIPALTEYVGDSEGDRLLCLVRAIREYLHRTRDCRPRCSHLFVTDPEPQHVVHPHTISHWICQVIQRAHEDVSEEDMRLVQVKAHEVRAVATSALFRKI
ncbi:hypothetical protein E2C01_075102 [Portunus trituberculatus]|uniref:Uncharacterized protein n=1 Tax=Portunus trituberculatus TaxID=210409 RepID=A0A5B7I9V0_PORTR|nr:hypothetical protein [Portunus trituberculatus]